MDRVGAFPARFFGTTMNASYTIRSARPADAERLTEIAFAAKRHHGYPEEWIAQWRQDLTIQPELVTRLHMVVAEDDTGILGFSALEVLPGESPPAGEIEHMWVHPGAIGRGIGRALFDAVSALASKLTLHSLYILSDPFAAGFYEKIGALKDRDIPSSIPGRTLPRFIYAVN